MGNFLKEWGEGKNQIEIELEKPLVKERKVHSSEYKEDVEKKAEDILNKMEDSYRRLERVLNIFDRMS